MTKSVNTLVYYPDLAEKIARNIFNCNFTIINQLQVIPTVALTRNHN